MSLQPAATTLSLESAAITTSLQFASTTLSLADSEAQPLASKSQRSTSTSQLPTFKSQRSTSTSQLPTSKTHEEQDMGPTDAVDGRRPKEYITRTRRPRAGFNQNPRKDIKESVDEVSAAQQKQNFNKSCARIVEDRGKPRSIAGPAQQPSKQDLDSVDQAPETHQKQDASRPRAHVSEHRDNPSSATNLPLPEPSQDTNDAVGVSGHQKKPSAKKQGPETLDQMFESQEAVSADKLPTQPSQSEAKQASGPVSPEKRSFEDVDHISDSGSDSDSSLSSLPPSPADLSKRARPPPGTYSEPAFNYVSGDDSSFSRPSLHSDDDDIETSSSGHDLGADTGSTSDSPVAVVNCNKTVRESLRKTADTLVGDQMDGVPISRRPTSSRKTSPQDAPLSTFHFAQTRTNAWLQGPSR